MDSRGRDSGRGLNRGGGGSSGSHGHKAPSALGSREDSPSVNSRRILPDSGSPLAGGEILAAVAIDEAKRNNEVIKTCLVRSSWEPTGNTYLPARDTEITGLAVKKGQEGFVIGNTYLDSTGNKWMKFILARSSTVGWVKEDNLNVGQPAGALKIYDDTANIPPPRAVAKGASVLQKTVAMLYSDIIADTDQLLERGADLTVLRDLKEQSRTVEKHFLDGIHRRVRQVIDSGNFTFDELRDIPWNSDNWLINAIDERAVIYLILFKDIDGIPGNDGVGLYIGKTINAGLRRQCHNNRLLTGSEPGHMYSIGRLAKEHRILILSDLTSLSLQYRDKVLRLAEHTGVSLFCSWTKVLLSSSFENASQATKYYFDAAMAKAFSDIAKKVFAKTGWRVCPGRGLNWKTPLTEALLSHTSFTCHVFAPDDDTGEVRVYRSAPRRLYKLFLKTGERYHVCDFLYGRKDNRAKVQLSVNLGDIEEYPTTVEIIVEIYTGKGKRHPVPFARLPEPGPFTSWEELNRVGVRCEWQDKSTFGQWRSAWLQAHNGPFPRLGLSKADESSLSKKAAEAYPHVSQLYIKTRRIYDALMQVHYTQDDDDELFPWIQPGPAIRIKEISYDHPKQTLIIRDQKPLEKKPPKLVSFAANFSAMCRNTAQMSTSNQSKVLTR